MKAICIKGCSLLDSESAMYSARLRSMPLFPRPEPRVYVQCPRCHTPWAFITFTRVDTQCSFCPQCQYLWDSVRQKRQNESPVVRRVTDRSGVT
jgi:hypothetical protein